MFRTLSITNTTDNNTITFGTGEYIVNEIDWGCPNVAVSSGKLAVGTYTYLNTVPGRTVTIKGYILGNGMEEITTRKMKLERTLRVRSDITINYGTYTVEGYALDTIKFGTKYKDNNPSFCLFTAKIYSDYPYIKATLTSPSRTATGTAKIVDNLSDGTTSNINIVEWQRYAAGADSGVKATINNLGSDPTSDISLYFYVSNKGTCYLNRIDVYDDVSGLQLGYFDFSSARLTIGTAELVISFNKNKIYLNNTAKTNLWEKFVPISGRDVRIGCRNRTYRLQFRLYTTPTGATSVTDALWDTRVVGYVGVGTV